MSYVSVSKRNKGTLNMGGNSKRINRSMPCLYDFHSEIEEVEIMSKDVS